MAAAAAPRRRTLSPISCVWTMAAICSLHGDGSVEPRGPLNRVPTIRSSIAHRSVNAAASLSVASPPPLVVRAAPVSMLPMLLIKPGCCCGSVCVCVGGFSCSRKSGSNCAGRSAMRSARAALAASPSGSLRTAISNNISAVLAKRSALPSSVAAVVACEAASTSLKNAVAKRGNPTLLSSRLPCPPAPAPPLCPAPLPTFPVTRSTPPLTNASRSCCSCSLAISFSTSRASNPASCSTTNASVGLNLPSARAIVATAADELLASPLGEHC